MKKRRKHRWNKLGQEEGERRTDLKINSIQCGEGRIDFCMHVGKGEKMAQKLDDLADCLFTLLSASLSLSLSLSLSICFFLSCLPAHILRQHFGIVCKYFRPRVVVLFLLSFNQFKNVQSTLKIHTRTQ